MADRSDENRQKIWEMAGGKGRHKIPDFQPNVGGIARMSILAKVAPRANAAREMADGALSTVADGAESEGAPNNLASQRFTKEKR